MRALSIRQPWLYAITDLDKRVENRTWMPHYSIIGQRIALHASKTYDDAGYAAIGKITGELPSIVVPRGAIVATAVVAGHVCRENGVTGVSDERFRPYLEDKWFFGPWGWILDDVRKLSEPIPCRGLLGLWPVPSNIIESLKQEATSS